MDSVRASRIGYRDKRAIVVAKPRGSHQREFERRIRKMFGCRLQGFIQGLALPLWLSTCRHADVKNLGWPQRDSRWLELPADPSLPLNDSRQVGRHRINRKKHRGDMTNGIEPDGLRLQ